MTAALRRHARHPLVSGSAALMGARLVSMVAGIATVTVVVRSLDERSFGFWSALVSLTTLTAGLDLGIGNATRNRIAALRATGDERGAAEAFGAALVVVAASSAALVTGALAVLAVAPAAGWVIWTAPERQAIAIAVILLGATQVGNLGQLALYAREQPAMVAALEAARWALTVPALLLVASAGGGLPLMTAAYFLALLLAAVAAFPSLLSHPGWRHLPPAPKAAWRIARHHIWVGAGFASLQLVATLVYQTDVLIAAQISTLATTGDFALVQRLYLVPLSLLFAAVAPLWARTSTEVARGNGQWARALAVRLAAAAAALLAVAGAAFAVLGPPAVEVWTGRRVDDLWLYAGFSTWLVIAGWVAVLSVVLNGVGRVWPQVRWLAVALVIKVLIAAIAVERAGVAALAWAGAISLLPLAVSNWREVRRPLGVDEETLAGEAAR